MAFFHRHEELRSELEDAGFDVETDSGLEGPTRMLPDLGERWRDDTRRKLWMQFLAHIETESALLGVSAHLLAIGRST